eukprot:s4538_g3.t1
MNHLRDSGAAPTSASHFIEAIRFSDQVFGLLKMSLSTTLTSRVTGAAHSMFMHKRKLKQAPAFSVDAVAVFEGLCNEDPRAHVRVICGAILFCIFACVRWFDAMRIESVGIDKYVTMCLLEAETALHKTSMSKESKTRLLPYTSLGRFLGSSDWAQSFMAARTKSGLDNHKLFLPSWNEVAQTWANHPMSSGEATCWIRELLFDANVEASQKFSSHSCKCTLLTWAGMCTIFTREERTLLGHHVEPQTKSSTTYSRDAQVLLQYKVIKVINLIRTGRLKPDVSRRLKPDVSRAERLSMMVNRDASNRDEDLADTWDEPDIGASDEDSEDLDVDEVTSSNCDEEDGQIRQLSSIFATDALALRSGNEDVLFAHLETILGVKPQGAEASNFRRLFFESHALALKDLQSRLERSDNSEVKILPLAEKVQRLEALKQKLEALKQKFPGIMLSTSLEPSHELIDRVVHQYEENCVKLIELHKCISREQEIKSERSTSQLSFDTQGNIKISKQSAVTECSASGEIKLRAAFTRRSLAYDLANVASFEVMESWTQLLFDRVCQDPPAGYRHISIDQIVQADRKIWVKISERTRSKVTGSNEAGVKNVDVAIQELAHHPDVQFHMLPLPTKDSS